MNEWTAVGALLGIGAVLGCMFSAFAFVVFEVIKARTVDEDGNLIRKPVPEGAEGWGMKLMRRSVPHADENHKYRCGLCKHLWLTLADDYNLRPAIKPPPETATEAGEKLVDEAKAKALFEAAHREAS